MADGVQSPAPFPTKESLSRRPSPALPPPLKTRDHSEIAMREFGADIKTVGRTTTVVGGKELEGRELYVPGDLSGAAFFLVAAMMNPDANVILYDVGVNPSRTALKYSCLLKQKN